MKKSEDISPRLSKIEKRAPFRVPENYFDNFPARLQERMDGAPRKSARIIRLIKPALAVAAGVAILFALVYLPLHKLTNNTQQITGNETILQYDYEETYLLGDLNDVDIMELLSEEETEEEISGEEMVDYLAIALNDYDIMVELENME